MNKFTVVNVAMSVSASIPSPQTLAAPFVFMSIFIFLLSSLGLCTPNKAYISLGAHKATRIRSVSVKFMKL
jgi:hypothetical protein